MRRGTSNKPIRPMGQGDLDSLCGIYSVVNAIRWLQRENLACPSPIEVFGIVIGEVDKVVETANVLIDGILPNKLWPVVQKVLRKLQREHGIALTASRPFFRRPGLTAQDMRAAIEADCGSTGAVYVVVFWGKLNHWSVVHQATDTHLMLYDSCGRPRIPVDHCQMPHEVPKVGERPHIFETAGIIRLSVGSPP